MAVPLTVNSPELWLSPPAQVSVCPAALVSVPPLVKLVSVADPVWLTVVPLKIVSQTLADGQRGLTVVG